VSETKAPILEIKNIKKSFYNNIVLKDISFSVERGTVLGLMGQNGAGKSTLVKILTGAYKKDGGSIHIEGKEVHFNTIKEANENGIALVFQELSLAPNMSVADNIFVNNWPNNKFNIVKQKELHKKTKQLLSDFNIDINPDQKITELSAGERQIVEILKAVSKNPKILILDEPTSSLEKKEIDVLFRFIRKLKEQQYSIIYISHHMEEVIEITDNIIVLRDGVKVLECKKEDTNVQAIVNSMIGKEQKKVVQNKEDKKIESDNIVMRVTDLTLEPYYRNINFSLRKGEILGIAGIVGSGKQALCESLYGIRNSTSGEISVHGSRITVKHPQDAKINGIIGLPENRKTQGLFMNHSIEENMIACVLKQVSNGLFLDNKKINEVVNKYKNITNIKMQDQKDIIRYLSGGNQQKVLVSKTIASSPAILIAMDPTRGIDVAAKADIHSILHELSISGLSVVVISSELEELLTMSDRILVINSGELTDEFYSNNFDENNIMVSMHQSLSEVDG